jgi:1-deoxy-D-xylulose-5-phosphate reductoisomerase
MMNIAVLGSTGSIGRSTLEVIAAFPDRFRVAALTAHRNIDLLSEQVACFKPDTVVVSDDCPADVLDRHMHRLGRANGRTAVLSGEAGLVEAATHPAVDMVVSALVGFAGLTPTLRAIEAGKDIALANKETLVVGGDLIMRAAREHGVRILPVDSEHSAILQCLQGEDASRVSRLLLTASGGPFRDLPFELFSAVTPEQALAHPTWRMGNKVTIDSATMMNKGLEVIEAFWLFGIPAERIAVVVHPQSIIHSMVEFVDGSIKAQLGVPDMKIPIQYALTYPDRGPSVSRRLDLGALGTMTFFPPDMERFRCLGLAFRALRSGGTAPAVLNAANEVAVELFLEGRISFPDIPGIIEEALDRHAPSQGATLEELIRIDRLTRAAVHERMDVVQ